MGTDSLDEQFAEFAWRTTQSDADLVSTMLDITDTARKVIGADGAGLTVIRAGGRLESLSDSELIKRSDKLQHELRQGPCVEAATENHNTVSGDLAVDERWPVWGPKVVDLGFRSVMSVSLHTAGRRRLGALNLYGHARQQFTSRDMTVLSLYAAHATAALWSAVNAHNLTQAIQTRTQIGEAIGILMQRYDLTEDQAASVLKRYSQNTNTKLQTLARDVITRRELPADGVDPVSGS
ncbi:GAF and ANTAR domain-containing protein [Microlunatus parietis]|uniref:GAF domain-containing protein n=1 Tax=Microlunatus parietis TaxID=682979 RepID=A0A7Y9IAA5_9ACTN|nr:GAF and ANTAR domain-containing protein [Microlunatus parietis]NYE72938.1 GAF domain-containing protein [Microlunatus parietis]